MKMVLEIKRCSTVIQILIKIFHLLLIVIIYIYLKSIRAETLLFHQCQPGLSISGCHFVAAE